MSTTGKSQSRSPIIFASTSLGILIAVLLLALLPAWANLSAAHHLTVCPAGPPGCSYSDIQSAVDAASDGEDIKIAAGRYSGVNNYGGLAQVVYIAKNLTLKGGYNLAFDEPPRPEANATIIDAEGQGRALYVAEGADVTVSGMRFTGGNAKDLGGDPGCDDQCTDYGAGIFVYSATFTLINSWVYSNPADHEVDYWLLGGGLATRDADAVIRDVHFHDNEARWRGGLALYGGQTQVENIVLSSNVGYWGGGGWFCNNAVVVKMSRSVLTDNEAQEGGGLFTCSSEVQITLEGNVFSGNHAEEGGGLAIKYGSDITLINNVIRENQADSSGAGFYADGGSSRLLHSTFVGNYGGDGSGIHLDGGRVAMTNTILVSHTVGISVAENSSADLEATLWGSGDSANDADWLGAGTILTGEINLWATPAFAPDGYHLTADSAAINNGIDAGVTTDIDGDPRPFVSLFDLGADEFITSRLFLPLLMR